MTTTEWAHLPNAAHIDRVIADMAQRPDAWDEAWKVQQPEVWEVWTDAWLAAIMAEQRRRHIQGYAERAAVDAAWKAVWNAAGEWVHDEAREAARGAILALAAWDDAGPFLDTPVPALRLYAANGSPVAILILPAAAALGDHS